MRSLLFAILLLFICAPVLAQDTPRVELFTGYSLLRTDDRTIDLNQFGLTGTATREATTLHGWNATLGLNFTGLFGVVVDGAGGYGVIDYSVSSPGLSGAIGIKTRLHTIMLGPQINVRGEELVFFIRAMGGVARIDQTADFAGLKSSSHETALAGAAGLGLDFRLSDSVWLRIIQGDYLITRFEEGVSDKNQQSIRISTGLVFR
ncbi:MAG: outer membrane beta-barrel protein [Acidobacteriota bacterium]|nr:MAG: outer membrane beta-barrel protein [Acidobacteriota bacterium]